MNERRLDVGFIPVSQPGAAGSGASQTATLLIEELSRRHDLTVYVQTQSRVESGSLPARDRVEYVVHDDLSMLPHPIHQKKRALEDVKESLNEHDLVHSYSTGYIPLLADIDVPTLVTLNSYLAICPKADYRYRGEEHCTGAGPVKCTECIARTAISSRRGLTHELKSAYLSAGRSPLVARSRSRCAEITGYQALSPHLRDDYVAAGFDRDRITVIPHFYDERFRPPDATPKGAPRDTQMSDAVDLLYVGALQEIKGVETLVRAVAHLEERGVDVELGIAGRGPLEETLRELAAELGVSDHIVWHGYVDNADLPEYYHRADVFVYPGVIEEPFGRVMLEALASGTPIVSADVGSMSSIIGPAGTTYSADEPELLADAIERLRSDYASHVASIPDQLEQFSPATVLDQFDDLYTSIATG